MRYLYSKFTVTSMKILPISRYRFFQKIQPTVLLKKITSNPVTGCLQVFSVSDSWSFDFREGKLIYASRADKMFNLLYAKLQHFSKQIPALAQKKVYQQLRVIFQKSIDNQAILNPDYLAICWLVEQKLITATQAKVIIKELVSEVLSSFLTIKEGSYEFTTETFMGNMPNFCNLDVNLLMENCQQKLQNQENNKNQPVIFNKTSNQIPTQQPLPKPGSTRINSQATNQTTNHSYNNDQHFRSHNFRNKVYTIVCIDDSPTVLNAIQSFLDEQFFNVIGFSEPLKALMQILSTNPDLILLDIEMPNLDGYELCSLLRKHSYFKDVPVIMVTGRKGLIDRAKAKMFRASGYLTKPFTQGELLKIIFQHLM